MAAVEVFLKIEGIEEESQDRSRKGGIDILDFSWGEGNSPSMHGGGGWARRLNAKPFNFTMKANNASPKIFLAVADGRHFRSAVLTVRRTDEQKAEFLTWTLSDVVFTSYRTAAETEASPFPMDRFSLVFSKIEIAYRPNKVDGTLGSPVKAGWDLKVNKPI
jgi:type VI secretion system secreted protein Hcp